MQEKSLDFYMFSLKIIIMILIIKKFLLENYLLSFFYTFLLLVFFFSYFLKKKFKLKYVYFFENLIYLLVFSYEFNLLYKNVPYWDTGMHALTGFIAVIFLVFLLKVFLKKIKVSKISFWLFSFFGFCFSLTIGVVFELYEYSIDKFFLKDMQKDYLVNDIATVKVQEEDLKKIHNIKKTIIYYQDNDKLQKLEIENGYLDIGLNDTMKDLIVNLIGSLQGSLYVYFCLKRK